MLVASPPDIVLAPGTSEEVSVSAADSNVKLGAGNEMVRFQFEVVVVGQPERAITRTLPVAFVRSPSVVALPPSIMLTGDGRTATFCLQSNGSAFNVRSVQSRNRRVTVSKLTEETYLVEPTRPDVDETIIDEISIWYDIDDRRHRLAVPVLMLSE